MRLRKPLLWRTSASQGAYMLSTPYTLRGYATSTADRHSALYGKRSPAARDCRRRDGRIWVVIDISGLNDRYSATRKLAADRRNQPK